MRIRLDKVASSTRNVTIGRQVVVQPDVPAKAGTVIACRVLDEKAVYNQLEDHHGRMRTVHAGDLIAGVLGERRALRGYSGVVPETVEKGDILHLLNLGGVIGHCTSINPAIGAPARVEVLGSVQVFPELGRRVGVPASIAPGPIALADELLPLPPVVVLAGTAMHAGKTAAACALVRAATSRGLRVGAAKVTGVALRRDTLEMLDHGAELAVTFAEAGLASTCQGPVLRSAKGCLNHLAQHAFDMLVVELGDGLMGEYGVAEVLADAQIRDAVGAVVLSANDPVAAWGGSLLLEELGYQATAITGPATDNEAGSRAINARVDTVVANARTQSQLLTDTVLQALGFPSPGPSKLEATA